jgi:transcriptional regulator with XRE-family HTH domain
VVTSLFVLEKKEPTAVADPMNTPKLFPHRASPAEQVRNTVFAKRLQEIMAQREMTQSKVAAEIWGRSLNSKGANVANGRDRLSVWVSGKNFPDPENLEKLARVLKVKTTDLAPDADMRTASRATPDATISFSQDYKEGMAWVQIAQYVPADIALEMMVLLRKADAANAPRPLLKERPKK